MATRTDFRRGSTADAMADMRIFLLAQAAIFLSSVISSRRVGGGCQLAIHDKEEGYSQNIAILALFYVARRLGVRT